MAGTGIDPIRYRPWSGKRTTKRERILVISKTLFMKKMKSKWTIVLMVLGYLGVWAFPIIFSAMAPHEALDGSAMSAQMGDEVFFVFTVLLASLACSDAISEDLRTNSFVLYFSRAIGKDSYLAGKIGGIFMTLALFCFIPPAIMAVAILGTQSGGSYLDGLGVVGLTLIAGLMATVFLIPFSLMVSALTDRKSFAAVGTFMTLFVLSIVGGIFSQFDVNWQLADPGSLLRFFFEWLYGEGIPAGVSGCLAAAMLLAFLTVPLALVYLRVHRKGVEK